MDRPNKLDYMTDVEITVTSNYELLDYIADQEKYITYLKLCEAKERVEAALLRGEISRLEKR